MVDRFPGDPGSKVRHGLNDNSDTAFNAVQAAVGRLFTLRRSYNGANWGVNTSTVDADVAAGRVPVTSWKLSPYTLTTVPDSAIDTIITYFQSKAPAPIWVTIYHEPEDDFTTSTQAADYRALYRRVVLRARTAGVTNVAWVSPFFQAPFTFTAGSGRDWRWWHPDWNGGTTNTAADWFSGTGASASVVDIDGYDSYIPLIGSTNWQTETTTYGVVTAKMSGNGYTPKPFLIGELGVKSETAPTPVGIGSAGDPTLGPNRMQDAFSVATANGFVGIAWWNTGGDSFLHGPTPANDPGGFREAQLATIVSDPASFYGGSSALHGTATYDSAGVSVASATLTAPGTVVVDDTGVLLVTWVGTSGETPPAVTAVSGTGNGWTVAAGFPRTDSNMGWTVLTRRVTAADSTTVTVTIPGTARLTTAAAAWYGNAQAITVGTVGSRGGVSSTTTTAPSMAASAGETILALFAERTTATGTTVSVSAGITRVYVEGTGSTTSSALIVDLASTGSTTGTVVATYSGTGSGNGAGVLVELVPVSAPPGDTTILGYAGGYTAGYGPTIVIIPPAPPGPPPPPPPSPGATPGAPNAPQWYWVSGPWSAGPDTLLTGATNRRITWRLTGRSEASFDLDGRSSTATTVDELVDDLWIIRSTAPGVGRAVFRGRIGPTSDTIGGDGHQVTVSAGDYRSVLDRRQLWEGAQLSWLNVDQSAIAWGLVQQTQIQPAGSLGIVRGAGQTTGIIRARNDYPPGKSVGEAVDQLSQVEGGFDWDITPHADPRNHTMYLDVFYPTRGVDRGVVLDYGGRVVAAGRQVDPGQYANAIRGTGADSTSTGGVLAPVRREAAGLLTRPEGRWDGSMADPDLQVQQTIIERTNRELATRQVITPSWTVTLAPNGWGGPDDVWLGDPVILVVKSGRLDVVESLQVREVACAFDESNTVTTTLTVGAIDVPGKRWSLRKVDQRLRALERR